MLGQYRLLDELGRGGMGQVFKACHTVMGRIVALKVLWPTPREHDLAQGWFEREVRTLTQLQHPNIVLAYDANEVDGVRFLVMEYVEGQNLQSLVREEGPLPIPLACDMMAEAATALQYAHEKGLVHRDVKPANLLVPVDVFTDRPTTANEETAKQDHSRRGSRSSISAWPGCALRPWPKPSCLNPRTISPARRITPRRNSAGTFTRWIFARTSTAWAALFSSP